MLKNKNHYCVLCIVSDVCVDLQGAQQLHVPVMLLPARQTREAHCAYERQMQELCCTNGDANTCACMHCMANGYDFCTLLSTMSYGKRHRQQYSKAGLISSMRSSGCTIHAVMTTNTCMKLICLHNRQQATEKALQHSYNEPVAAMCK